MIQDVAILVAYKTDIEQAIVRHFGVCNLKDDWEFFGNTGMQYGYVAIDNRSRHILIVDSTPDEGDLIRARLPF